MPDNKKFWQFRNQAGGTVELSSDQEALKSKAPMNIS